jgi:predicted dehydrogenase
MSPSSTLPSGASAPHETMPHEAMPNRSQERRPRLGFVGVGWIGRNRMEAVVQSGLAEVVAVHDVHKRAMEDARAAAPGAEACASLDDLLERAPDGVVIATPNALHAEQALRALERGCAVFCQKPLARTASESARVVEAARAADRLLGVDLSYRHLRGVPELRRRILAGDLGRVHALDLVFHNAYGPDKPWFDDARLSGGGCMLDLGVHLVDLARWLTGNPRVEEARGRCFARGAESGPDDVEDLALAELMFASGACARIACGWRISAGCDALISIWIHGTHGGARIANVGGSFYDFTVEHFRGRERELLAEPPDAWGGRAIVEWVERVAGGERFDAQALEHVTTAEILDRVRGRFARETIGSGA